LFFGIAFVSEKQIPIFVVISISGEPVTKLIFYSAGFVPGEKIKGKKLINWHEN